MCFYQAEARERRKREGCPHSPLLGCCAASGAAASPKSRARPGANPILYVIIVAWGEKDAPLAVGSYVEFTTRTRGK